MRTITATLTINDDATPPGLHLRVNVDSATVAERDLTPRQTIAWVKENAPGAADALKPVVRRLRDAVKRGAEEQAAREAALELWEEVAPEVP